MPDLYLGKAVSNDDCDALASYARNRLQSDRVDRCQESGPHFRFVAPGATRSVLLLLLVVGPEQKAERRPGRPMTGLVVGEVSGEPDPGSFGRSLSGGSDRAPRVDRRDRLVG